MTAEEEERPGRRQRSLHCKPAEQAMIRERAEAASKTVSRYVMELALADDPDRHPLVLSEEEQAELRDGVLELQALARALRRELPGGSGLSLLSAISVLARGAGAVSRKRRRKVGKHISLSATGRGLGDRSQQRNAARPVDRALPGGAGGAGRFGRGRRSPARVS